MHGAPPDGDVEAALHLLADVPFEELQERGWHLQPNDFYWPLNDVPFLRRRADLWQRARIPPGIEWALAEQVELAHRLARGEVSANVDAALVAELRPRRIVHVGNGRTPLEESPEVVRAGHGEALQRAGTEMFDALEPGDVLFYDGMRSARAGSDLNWVLFIVLPRLSAGVWIHFPDVFWPHDYPSEWLLDEGRSWNGQYLLQAFLMHNQAYRVRLATAMLAHERPEVDQLPGTGSLWLEKRGPARRSEPPALPELPEEPAFRRWAPRRSTGGAPAQSGPGQRPYERPRPGPELSAEIDRSLALLSELPFEELQQRGWHLQRTDGDSPLNDVPFLRRNPDLWVRPRLPASIDWELDAQEDLVSRIAGHAPELEDVADTGSGRGGEFVWQNGVFTGADAYAYYGLVRELEPARVVEVGAGWSSTLLARALRANQKPASVTLVDPIINRGVLGDLVEQWDVIERGVQHVDPGVFASLQSGDVLFYDGSHCVRTAGDVNWMLFHVLPSLADGVWIHFHDIFWPREYFAEWVLNDGLSWNEQYALEAFLSGNDRYRVRLAVGALRARRRDRLRELLPRVSGGSVWLQKGRRVQV